MCNGLSSHDFVPFYFPLNLPLFLKVPLPLSVTLSSVTPSPHHPLSVPQSPLHPLSQSPPLSVTPPVPVFIFKIIIANKLFTQCEITFHDNSRWQVNRLLIIICNDYIYDVPNSYCQLLTNRQ